jgi:hypothetical protein
MRFRLIFTLMLLTSFSVLARTSLAQAGPNSQPPSPGQGPGATARGGMAPSGNMQMGPMTWGAQGPGKQAAGAAGPLQEISKLMSAVDDPRMKAAIGLTDQQADGLRKIIVDTETFTITTGASIAVDSIQLRELLRADKPDRAAVKSKGDEISKATSQLIDHGLDAILSAKEILTPEQQKKIREYIADGAPAFPPPPPPRR